MKTFGKGDFTHDAETHLTAARSFTALLYGIGGEAFRAYNDTIQDHVLWLLSMEIDRAVAAFYAPEGQA